MILSTGRRAVLRADALTILLLLSLAPATAAQQPASEGLRPGDVVRVTVFRKPELSGEMEVASDGTLLHPLYRAIQTTGVPLPALEQRVGEFLQRYEAEPSFVVETFYRVTVGGEVRQPDAYTVRPGTTVFQALAEAGGRTAQGQAGRVRLLRDGTVQVLSVSHLGSAGGTLPVRSGDVLVVDRRVDVLREYVQPGAAVLAALIAVVNLFSGN